ncbi:MAG: histidinol dehydrogenase [Christensenellaceae bacterium]|jgi:histidinol dehydrogenase
MLKRIMAAETDAIQKRLMDRAQADFSEQQTVVDKILQKVRTEGDEALFDYVRKLDGFDITRQNMLVSKQEIEDAYAAVDRGLVSILREAADNIRAFHSRQKRENWFIEKDGKMLGQLYLPIENACVYVPGGKAAYPSSVLMNIIPAKCAGVENIFVATPAMNGTVNPVTIVAADISGADKIFKLGGAHAVAAFAYGTESVPKADKITGPGNIYVTLAKKSVFGIVGIDMIAGPSEILVIADDTANPAFVAADLLSQAEHDELAAPMLVTTSERLADAVDAELRTQLSALERKGIAKRSIQTYGTCIITESIEESLAVSNRLAPEHLELCLSEPQTYVNRIKNAGSVFVGPYSPEPLGDYFAGVNHILPTNGTARFSSPLNVDDFQKKSSVLYYTKEEFEKVYGKVAGFAESEGLTAHARSARIRFEQDKT